MKNSEIKVLASDADAVNLEFVNQILNVLNSKFISEHSFLGCIELLQRSSFDVLIADPFTSSENPLPLLKKLNEISPNLQIIIFTAESNYKKIIQSLNEIKNSHYIAKPASEKELKQALEGAFNTVRAGRKSEDFSASEKKFYNEMIQIFDWKKEITKRKIDYFTKDLIHQVNIGFLHGAGLGSLIGSLSLMFSKAEISEDSKDVIIPKFLYDVIYEDYEQSRILMQGLSFAQNIIMEDSPVKETSHPDFIHSLIKSCAEKLEPMFQLKSQKAVFGSFPSFAQNTEVSADAEKLEFAFSEILINAMKYSKTDDIIYILFYKREDNLEIKILNPAYEFSPGILGISGIHETLVFEPFFRIIDSVDDEYSMETVKFGLGLTLARKIFELHGGDIIIFNVGNNLNQKEKTDVCASVRLPLKKTEFDLMSDLH